MTGYDLTEAVEAGMRELHGLRCCDGEGPLACTPSEMTDDENNAANAIRAALPHLEQQIRDRIGDELDAEYDRRSPVPTDAAYQYSSGVLDGLDIAEQIARTRKDT